MGLVVNMVEARVMVGVLLIMGWLLMVVIQLPTVLASPHQQ